MIDLRIGKLKIRFGKSTIWERVLVACEHRPISKKNVAEVAVIGCTSVTFPVKMTFLDRRELRQLLFVFVTEALGKFLIWIIYICEQKELKKENFMNIFFIAVTLYTMQYSYTTIFNVLYL